MGQERNYKANENYIDLNVVLLAKKLNDDVYLEPGQDYTYPFNVNLPVNLPMSFEHKVGQIRYSINGTINIPW
jgi:sporulation-control protein spo0M